MSQQCGTTAKMIIHSKTAFMEYKELLNEMKDTGEAKKPKEFYFSIGK